VIPLAVMAWADLIIKYAPTIIELGQKAGPLAAELARSIRSEEQPTPEAIARLDKLETEARGVLHAPFKD
jgi:hypothetical protein